MPNSQITYLKKAFTYVVNRYVLSKPFLIGISEEYGIKLKFRTQDGGGRAIYKKGVYEAEISELLIRNLVLSAGDVILDVGANIGWYSLLISRFENPDISIHSFEPDPDNYACLVHNLELNKAHNVHAHVMGVSDVTGTKTLFLYKKSNTGRHSMLEINSGDSIDVQTVSLDDFLVDQSIKPGSVKFLKIDIEGFEYFAFQGGRSLLAKVPYVIAEFSPGYMRKGGVEPAKLLNLLRSHDYRPYSIDIDVTPIADETLLDRENNINLLWVKNGAPIWK